MCSFIRKTSNITSILQIHYECITAIEKGVSIWYKYNNKNIKGRKTEDENFKKQSIPVLNRIIK